MTEKYIDLSGLEATRLMNIANNHRGNVKQAFDDACSEILVKRGIAGGPPFELLVGARVHPNLIYHE